MEFFKKLIVIVFIGFVLIACGNPIAQTEVTITDTPLLPSTPSKTPFPTLPRQPTFTVVPTKTITLTPTLNPTQQIWVATNVSIRATQRVINENERENRGKEIDKFPIVCSDSYDFDVSPDFKWLATNCGDKTYSILVVQNKEGTKWVLDFEDFLDESFSEGVPGGVGTVFWDMEGQYLYFTVYIGWSGGGNYCFPEGGGGLGLFRLNLKNGSVATLIDRHARFPGDKMRFSPTGRRFAVDINGITITDLQTGNEIQLNVSGVMDLIWSPDGRYLAYSVSRCNKEGFIIDSSLYVWDSLINESRFILQLEKTILYPTSWDDISNLEVYGQDYTDNIYDATYLIYEYDITQEELILDRKSVV